MAVYAEYPLPEEGFIRTVTIHPGDWRSELEISLNIAEFLDVDPPAYEALSYVWGSEYDPDTVRIITNTSKTFILPVTQNLATALRLLRRPDGPRVIWTDAICINQANNIEKGQQVMRMGDIFRTASRVVGFLGEESDDSARAMNIMSYIGSQVDVNWEPVNMWPSKHCADPTVADRHCKLPVGARDMCAIYHIIHRGWFERLWIRQEILLANDSAILQCGKVETSWREFRSALLCLFVKPAIGFEHSYSFRRRLEFISGLIFPRRNISLIALRVHFDGAICRDPRDKIFAIRSLLAPSERACCLVPDYSKPWEEVYKDVALRWLRKFRFLALLRECHFDPDASHPSWVPNWSKLAPARPLCQQPFLASSRLATPIESPVDGILRVSGVTCAEVQEIYHVPDLSNATMEELFNIHRQTLFGHGVGQIDGNLLSDDLLEAYAKTLVWGCIDNEMSDIPFIRLPSLGEAKKVIAELYSESRYAPELFQPGSPGYEFLQRSRVVGGKKFARCSNGYFGMAPPHTQVGDHFCVLIGFNGIAALRPMPNDQFVLLGEAYIDQLRIGEGLLGPLPENVQIFLTTHANKAIFGFRDKESADITFEDPRLRNLRIDLSDYREQLKEDGSAILFVDPQVFASIGVNVQSFDMI
ncbi:HET-domain-containing protein [Daldinia caldariorum]|uniref:HET-domain-containing protein n=1 Tax=Daldinia caldariorum TaxID=326644 RepID=UPI002007F928|nr:HET-domain-containing protein [Daldinia caldariorum]KAI1469849.1 HET-domain-containing protein [Daldinia caldariorum]